MAETPSTIQLGLSDAAQQPPGFEWCTDGSKSLPDDLQHEVERLNGQFQIDTAKLKEITQRFRQELKEGLNQDGQNIPMNVTWVLGFPHGQEKGSFLTIDLGGTHLRICWVTLKGGKDGIDTSKQSKYDYGKDLKTSDAESLWDFVAESMGQFISEQDLQPDDGEEIFAGLTFSYPAIQDHVDQGVLQTWTKGWEIDGVEGEDVADQFRKALKKRKLPVHVVVLINDTTGAMIASAYNDPETCIGAVFGTGCNAAYMEKCGSIPKLKSSNLPDDLQMAINCEYGAFDNAHKVLPRTSYDKTIDEESPKPGEQAFEKMSAGLYLGEIFRLVLVELHEKGLIFRDKNVADLKKAYSIDSSLLSAIEDDELDMRKQFEEDVNITPNDDELVLFQCLARMISLRGARLCACGVAAICLNTDTRRGHVAADGSVAIKQPKFKERWTQALGEILDWASDDSRNGNEPIKLTKAEDGSGVGAAVIAAMVLERAKKGDYTGINQKSTKKLTT